MSEGEYLKYLCISISTYRVESTFFYYVTCNMCICVSFCLDLWCTWRETCAKPLPLERIPANQHICLSVWTYWLCTWVAAHHLYWVQKHHRHKPTHIQTKYSPFFPPYLYEFANKLISLIFFFFVVKFRYFYGLELCWIPVVLSPLLSLTQGTSHVHWEVWLGGDTHLQLRADSLKTLCLLCL